MLNILTVDDDTLTQLQLAQLLQPFGRHTAASSGEEAIKRVAASMGQGQGFDLILVDVLMPGLDGLKTVSEIVSLQNDKRVPLEKRPRIVMLSSVSERETQIDALYACGADHYLMKPLDEETLRAALAEMGLLKS